jgi:hypothetical protein
MGLRLYYLRHSNTKKWGEMTGQVERMSHKKSEQGMGDLRPAGKDTGLVPGNLLYQTRGFFSRTAGPLIVLLFFIVRQSLLAGQKSISATGSVLPSPGSLWKNEVHCY